MKPLPDVVLIGTGRLAHALASGLHARGIRIRTIVGRDRERTQVLADSVGAGALTAMVGLSPEPAIYFLAVSDDAIPAVADALGQQAESLTGHIVHGAGSVPSDALHGASLPAGVFYPVQSFVPNRPVDWATIPLCLTAEAPATAAVLETLAQRMQGPVQWVSDEQRQVLHLAAVWANNFPTFCLAVAAERLEKSGLPFDLLRPLVAETADRAAHAHPKTLQTGPAVRGDQATMQRHEDQLSDDSDLVFLYDALSQAIRRRMG